MTAFAHDPPDTTTLEVIFESALANGARMQVALGRRPEWRQPSIVFVRAFADGGRRTISFHPRLRGALVEALQHWASLCDEGAQRAVDDGTAHDGHESAQTRPGPSSRDGGAR